MLPNASSERARPRGRPGAAVASRPLAREAADAMLTRWGAVEAVAAGVLVAAALSPSVLLGPVQILVGGAGAGLRAVDGRGRQPGRGAPRPRGFVSEEEIASAARVAAPALPAALATALATAGGATLGRVMGPALEIARARAKARADVLERLARRGASALAEGPVAAELVAACGRLAGGILTVEDLEKLRPTLDACETTKLRGGEMSVATAPWGAAAVRDDAAEPADASHVELVAATDARGVVAVACYEAHPEGLAVPELELVAPFFATPVRRGEPRVRPGTPLAAAAPVALVLDGGVVKHAAGVARERDAEARLRALLRAVGAGRPWKKKGEALFV